MNSVNKKRTRRFNVIDLLIIVAIIATVLFAVKTVISDLFADNITKIEYTVKVSGVNHDDISKLKPFDKIRISNGNSLVGSIKEVSSYPAVSYVFNYETDRFIAVENTNKYDLFLKIEAGCGIKNNQFSINGNIISANKELNPVLPFEFKDAIITSVSRVGVVSPERTVESNEK